MREIWRDIPTWKGIYQASSHGRLRRTETGRVLKQHMGVRGYLHVNFTDGPRRETILVHQAVAAAFKRIPRNGRLTCHYDGDTKNNAPGNLLYQNQKGNMADALRHDRTCRGERHGAAKLTKSQVIKIRGTDTICRLLADEFGVHLATIARIRKGDSWSWL